MQQSLKKALLSNQKTQGLVQYKQVFDQILKRLQNQNLQQFTKYLQSQDCDQIKPEYIFKVINFLSNIRQVIKTLGQKFIKLWFLWKLFQCFDILKSTQTKQRNKLSKIFNDQTFEGSNLHAFLINIINKSQLSDISMIDDIQNEFKIKKQEIQSLFHFQPQLIEYKVDKGQQEIFDDLISDYKLFPEKSIIKILQRQIIVSFLKKYPEGIEKWTKIQPNNKKQNSIDDLKKQFLKQFQILNTELQQLFKKLQITTNNNQYYIILCAIKAKIFPIDVLELLRLINKTKKSKQLIQDKEIIYIFGTTGAGKSTNILKFLGYDLKKTVVNNLTTLAPIGPISKQHQTFIVSPQSKSCTRYINAVKVPQKMYIKGTLASKMNIYICDTPGLGDSAGADVDIANGVGMIDALQGAKNVRVVLLIAHQFLIYNRLQGAVNIGQTVSSLFFKLSDVASNLIILFNKVPKQLIKQIPVKIQDKINKLTPVQKSNQKLVGFLNILYQQSLKQQNYVDPLKTDYVKLFQTIIKIDPIDDIKNTFKYDFTESTKKQIHNYNLNEKNKIKEYYNSERYNEAKFHLELLHKLKDILFTNDKIKQNYFQITKYINKQADKQFRKFQQLIKDIYQGDQNQKTITDLKQKITQGRINLIHQYFSGIEGIQIKSKYDIKQLIQQYKLRLQQKLTNLEDVKIQKNFKSLKVFSQNLAPQLEERIVKLIDKKIQLYYKELQILFQQKQYGQMPQIINKVTNVTQFITMILNNNSLEKKKDSLQLKLKDEFIKNYQYIQQNILKSQNQLIPRIIKNSLKYYKQNYQIYNLPFFLNSLEHKNKIIDLEKRILGKCKQNIRELQNLDLTGQQNNLIDQNFIKQLSRKKNDIEKLMQFSHVKQILAKDYEYTIQNIQRKLKQSIEILQNAISALKTNKQDQIEKSIDIIKKSIDIVLKCSRIINDGTNVEKLTQTITEEFINYINSVKRKMNQIQFRLNLITKESLQKIDLQNRNNQTISKMSKINDRIKQAVQSLQSNFLEILKKPFIIFKQSRDILILKQRKDYKSLFLCLQNLEKMCFYSLQIQQILTYSSYNKTFNQEQNSIIEILKTTINQISEQYTNFINLNNDQISEPIYLRELVRILLGLKNKSYTLIYLNKKLYFDVQGTLDNIKHSLNNIKSTLQICFTNINSQQNIHKDLQQLRRKCNFYISIQDVFRFQNQSQKINFRQLGKNINDFYSSNLKDSQQRALHLIKGVLTPSKISWNQIKDIYQQFVNLKNPDGARRRLVVVNELSKIQKNIMTSLNQLDNRITNDSSILINDISKISEFVQNFRQANQLKIQLNNLYQQNDKKVIQITNKFLRGKGSNLIEVFQNQFKSVYRSMNDYNLFNIKVRINNFGNLQNIINSIFLEEERNQESQQFAQRFTTFMKQKKEQLKNKILSNQYASQNQKKQMEKNMTLKQLFINLNKCTNNQIQTKYGDSQIFIIDQKFKIYFLNVSQISRESGNNQLIQDLKTNLKEHFIRTFELYEEKLNSSIQQLNKCEQEIIKKINFLPTQLKKQYNEQFKNIKQKIRNQNNNIIQNLIQKVRQNPHNINDYFIQSENSFKIGQKIAHNKFVQKINDIYNEKSKNCHNISQKISFIENYFIGPYRINQLILKNDQIMLCKIQSKFQQQIKKCLNIISVNMQYMSNFVQNPSNFNHQNINLTKIPNQCFKLYLLMMQDTLVNLTKNQINFQSDFQKLYQQKLNKINDIYRRKITSRNTVNLSSNQILDQKNVRIIKEQIVYLRNAGKFIEILKTQLQNFIIDLNDNKYNLSNLLGDKYKSLPKFDQNINVYENQVKNMVKFIQQYEFYNEQKKNKTLKELQVDLLTFDRILQILFERKQFFHDFILNGQFNYDFNNIMNRIKDNCNNFLLDCQNQIKEVFTDYNSDEALKTGLLINILKIIKNNKFKFIFKDQIQTKIMNIQRLLSIKFKEIHQQCSKKVKEAIKKSLQINQKIKQQQEAKKNKIIIVKTQIHEKLKKQTNLISKKFDEKISNQTDNNKKMQHQKAKNNQINSIKNEINIQQGVKINQIESKAKQIITKLKQILNEPIKKLTQDILLYKKALMDIHYDSDKNNSQFQTIFNQISKSTPKFIRAMQNNLNNNQKDQKSIGKLLLTTNKIFSNFVTNMINDLIRGQDINYVIANLEKINQNGRQKMQESELKRIDKCFKIWKQKYEDYKKLYKQNPQQSMILRIITQCKDLGKQISLKIKENKKCKDQKLNLLSGIFALWVILKAQKYDEQIQYTIQPHPTQITTLILLLGISHVKQQLDNRLAQVGTGQGKSIVLAGLCSFMGIIGFNVRCACYSSYLSKRDEANFRMLFERLGIQNKVKYGTFNELCQDILNSDGKDFKNQVQQMLLQKPESWLDKFCGKIGFNTLKINRGPNQIINNPTMLIVDQVDVFFDQNYYGNIYSPGIKLKHNTVSAILRKVFQEVKNKRDNVSHEQIIASKEFKDLVKQYPSLSSFLQNQIYGMISGALSYQHDYFIIDKKLVYKDNDSISPNISYGYKTVFANLLKFNKGNISADNLEDSLQIGLLAAEFSYAKLPNYFKNIMGVTGTLEVLPRYKKQSLLTRYKIQDQYAIPSAFGLQNKRIQNYTIVPQRQYWRQIISNIISIDSSKHSRPIIIFFKNIRQLNEFSQSSQFQSYLKRSFNLTEQHQSSVRDSRISRAVNANIITLMTSSFGRGTDFILLDKNIKENGGLHVIQAFLSLDQSQQVQIKGRTARQSNKGSYYCVINENQLQQLELTSQSFPPATTSIDIHRKLLNARQERIQKLSQTTLKMLKQSDIKHEQTIKIFTQQKLSQKNLIDYIIKLNQYPVIQKINLKNVVAIDATGSMGHALKKTCQIINETFIRVYKVLQDRKVNATIQIKLMVYRNYNSPFNQILEGTAFQNTPVNLKRFLDRIGPSGGWGNQAIQVLLQNLNRQKVLDQIILIGDAAPNTQNQVNQKRKQRGQNYWDSNGFPLTYFEKELQKFLQRKCPIHSFYLAKQSAFMDISRRTGGKSSSFNINSPKVSDELTAFIVQNILQLIQVKSGKPSGQLINTYRKMFT